MRGADRFFVPHEEASRSGPFRFFVSITPSTGASDTKKGGRARFRSLGVRER